MGRVDGYHTSVAVSERVVDGDVDQDGGGRCKKECNERKKQIRQYRTPPCRLVNGVDRSRMTKDAPRVNERIAVVNILCTTPSDP